MKYFNTGSVPRFAGVVKTGDLTLWNAAIGLRNRIVHDYMNIDLHRVLELVKNGQYRFISEFLWHR